MLIHTYLSYNGGSLAAVYACKALQERGYGVILAVPGGNDSFIEEVLKEDVAIVVYPALPYLKEEDLNWVRNFNAVIVNTFYMIQCACEISKVKPVIWWLHEPGAQYEDLYPSIRYQFAEYAMNQEFCGIDIYTVSAIAKNNFRYYYADINANILPYGIPDECSRCNVKTQSTYDKNKMIFAIIGQISATKAQKLFIEAVGRLNDIEKTQAEFWIIGEINDNFYGRNVQLLSETEASVKICGQMSRREICKAYEEIDVVVCPSLEETMSIVLTEGMMHGKICISSDNTGMARYIDDGRNGFLCKVGDVEELANRMRWLICNQRSELLVSMRKEARRTYEQNFAMEVFADNIERALQQTYKRLNMK